MKKQDLRKIIKECIKSLLIEIESYDSETDQFSTGPRDRTEPIETEPEIDKAKMKMLNDILITCGDMQKRVHSLTDTTIINGIRNIQDTIIKLMKSLGAK